MPLSVADVRHIALLARLELSPEGETAFASKLDHILSHFEKLKQLDTDAVEPTVHIVDMATPFRDDIVRNRPAVDALLANAPALCGIPIGIKDVPDARHSQHRHVFASPRRFRQPTSHRRWRRPATLGDSPHQCWSRRCIRRENIVRFRSAHRLGVTIAKRGLGSSSVSSSSLNTKLIAICFPSAFGPFSRVPMAVKNWSSGMLFNMSAATAIGPAGLMPCWSSCAPVKCSLRHGPDSA